MFLFFKNTVKKLKSGIHFTDFVNLNKLSVSSIYVKNQLSISIGGTQIITNKGKYTCFYKIIHFAMQFSAIVHRFIVKT